MIPIQDLRKEIARQRTIRNRFGLEMVDRTAVVLAAAGFCESVHMKIAETVFDADTASAVVDAADGRPLRKNYLIAAALLMMEIEAIDQQLEESEA